GLRAVDKRQGWRGPLVRLDPDEVKPFLEALDEERGRRFPPEETPELASGKLLGAPIWDLSQLTTKSVRVYLESSLGRAAASDADETLGETSAPVTRWPAMRSVRTTSVKQGRIVGGVVKKVDAVDK